jgi:hypothetical protein
MHRTIIACSIAVATAAAFPAFAQSTQGHAVSQPGLVGMAQTINVMATIKAIDQSTREITLVGPGGREVTVTAGPEVKNFAQLKSGDRVDVQYAEALTVELKKGGGKAVGMTEKGGVASARAGSTPGAAGARQVTVTGDVVDLDPATQHVTVRGAKHTVNLKVRDPEQFKLIAKGDQLEATYTEAVAVDVRPAK